MDNNNFGQELAKQTLDQIPQANSNAKRIVGLGPSGEIRTPGVLIPKNSGNFLLTISAPFWDLLFRKSCFFRTLVSAASMYSKPGYGQICGQKPLP